MDHHSWYALRVRSRFEKTVRAALQGKGYQEFLPIYRKRTRWSDRVKDVELPLFPGYVFSRFDVRQRLPILMIPGVVHVVGVGLAPEPVAEHEIEAIRRLVASGLSILPWPYLEVGQTVVVERGSLTGMEGILLQIKSQCRLVMSISLLQRSVAVEIERDWVRPVRPAVCHRNPHRGPSGLINGEIVNTAARSGIPYVNCSNPSAR